MQQTKSKTWLILEKAIEETAKNMGWWHSGDYLVEHHNLWMSKKFKGAKLQEYIGWHKKFHESFLVDSHSCMLCFDLYKSTLTQRRWANQHLQLHFTLSPQHISRCIHINRTVELQKCTAKIHKPGLMNHFTAALQLTTAS